MTARISVLALHGLGGAAATYGPLREALADVADVVPIDLPGFGERSAVAGGGGLRVMTQAAMQAVPRVGGGPFLLMGHSMGGKVAQLVAAALRDLPYPTFAPAGLILLAPSPATPEPMPDAKREEMLGWARDGLTVERAEHFLHDDCARALTDRAHRIAVQTFTGSSARAWRRWLIAGSTEDVSRRVGSLELPALVLGGDQDEALGASAQPGLQARALPYATFGELADTGHQIPLERPHEAADAIRTFLDHTLPEGAAADAGSRQGTGATSRTTAA